MKSAPLSTQRMCATSPWWVSAVMTTAGECSTAFLIPDNRSRTLSRTPSPCREYTRRTTCSPVRFLIGMAHPAPHSWPRDSARHLSLGSVRGRLCYAGNFRSRGEHQVSGLSSVSHRRTPDRRRALRSTLQSPGTRHRDTRDSRPPHECLPAILLRSTGGAFVPAAGRTSIPGAGDNLCCSVSRALLRVCLSRVAAMSGSPPASCAGRNLRTRLSTAISILPTRAAFCARDGLFRCRVSRISGAARLPRWRRSGLARIQAAVSGCHPDDSAFNAGMEAIGRSREFSRGATHIDVNLFRKRRHAGVFQPPPPQRHASRIDRTHLFLDANAFAAQLLGTPDLLVTSLVGAVPADFLRRNGHCGGNLEIIMSTRASFLGTAVRCCSGEPAHLHLRLAHAGAGFSLASGLVVEQPTASVQTCARCFVVPRFSAAAVRTACAMDSSAIFGRSLRRNSVSAVPDRDHESRTCFE